MGKHTENQKARVSHGRNRAFRAKPFRMNQGTLIFVVPGFAAFAKHRGFCLRTGTARCACHWNGAIHFIGHLSTEYRSSKYLVTVGVGGSEHDVHQLLISRVLRPPPLQKGGSCSPIPLLDGARASKPKTCNLSSSTHGTPHRADPTQQSPEESKHPFLSESNTCIWSMEGILPDPFWTMLPENPSPAGRHS